MMLKFLHDLHPLHSLAQMFRRDFVEMANSIPRRTGAGEEFVLSSFAVV